MITDRHHASGDTQTNDAGALVLVTDHGSLSVAAAPQWLSTMGSAQVSLGCGPKIE